LDAVQAAVMTTTTTRYRLLSRQGAMPRPGDMLLIDEAASVQFQGDRSLLFRVIRVDSRTTYAGWAWLHGYVLDNRRRAVERRDIFVQLAGLKLPVWDLRNA
jgi:hypothetical protein